MISQPSRDISQRPRSCEILLRSHRFSPRVISCRDRRRARDTVTYRRDDMSTRDIAATVLRSRSLSHIMCRSTRRETHGRDVAREIEISPSRSPGNLIFGEMILLKFDFCSLQGSRITPRFCDSHIRVWRLSHSFDFSLAILR